MATTIQSLLTIERELARDFNAGKIDRLLAHFHRRVVGFSSTRQDRIAGRSAVKETFDFNQLASSRMRYSVVKPRVQVFGDAAVVTFYWTVELGADRPRHTICARGTHFFVHTRGQWWIVHEHFSWAQ